MIDKISTAFTTEEEEQINQALTSIEQVLKGKVINLTPDEKQQYGRLGNKTQNWINKIDNYMVQKPELVPFYIKKDEFDKDMSARDTIIPILKRINGIQESLDDTSKLLSNDIYNTAIAYYRSIKIVALQNIPGTTSIYQDLATQFPGRRSVTPEEPSNN
ncbi:MAG: hypothetical protein MI739_03340 [Bacteroidales bacterium]|nr:hypothetical protein [Bacteroidales bacterium]